MSSAKVTHGGSHDLPIDGACDAVPGRQAAQQGTKAKVARGFLMRDASEADGDCRQNGTS